MLLSRLFACFVCLVSLTSVSEAGPFRKRGLQTQTYHSQQTYQSQSTVSCANRSCSVSLSSSSSSVSTESVSITSSSALDEVNAKRVARGLRPFVHDPLLTRAAERCASFRAQHGLFGHTSNDFQFVEGTSCSAAGCAAYPASYGWLSCCTYDNYTYAGAAYVTGADGKRYMHLYVR
jgi:hypothetical protein